METERILLRPWLESDAETLFKCASDPDVGPRAGWPPHQSVEESLMVIRDVYNRDTNTWAIVLKETGEPMEQREQSDACIGSAESRQRSTEGQVIGAMGYGASCDCKLPVRENEPIAGYWVAKPFWNKGYCTEALQLMLDHIRKTTDIKSLLSGHFTDNPASGRVMEKCGFVPTGEECFDETQYMGKDKPIRILRLEFNR